MRDTRIKRIIFAALMTALTCIATMVVQIRSPFGEYINLGDGFVLISGFLLGPVYGAFAAGVGSALADLLSGFSIYAPGTMIIKALTAFVATVVFMALHSVFQKRMEVRENSETAMSGSDSNKSTEISAKKHGISYPAVIVSSLVGEAIMVVGYFAYAFIIGNGGTAAAGVPGNALQALIGTVMAVLLWPILVKVGLKAYIKSI